MHDDQLWEVVLYAAADGDEDDEDEARVMCSQCVAKLDPVRIADQQLLSKERRLRYVSCSGSQHPARVEQGNGRTRIDVQTRREGNSAALVVQNDQVRVVHGGLYAKVEFKAIGVDVVMNPDFDGNWCDVEWASARAWQEARDHLSLEAFHEVLDANRAEGRKEGRKQLQRELRRMLGVIAD